jgi:hypothetical protein
VDENAIADSGVGQAVGLIHPAADGARIAIYFSGKRYKVEIVFEKKICGVGHRGTVPLGKWTVHDNYARFSARQKR